MEVDEETEKSPVAEKEDVIKPINRETVHRICSGQVVLSLSIAVKELIENSIDANAKNIEIRLKEYGMDLLEVVDNGSGVREENFEALTLKHYTSKIRQFDDLESICTLGFRGEALSSLCALSDLTVITRHESAEHGTKLIFDNNGKLLSKTPIARPVGTTVSLANLFSTLPVRRKEYVKNYKREFNKMCNLLYAYCLVAKSVKFTCTNQTVKGTNSTVVSTLGTDSIKDNIISIFGPKQISSLIEMPLVKPDETTAQEFNIKIVESDPSPFEFDCYISSVTHGNGRSTADRQFYFINSRPCEPTKLMKLVNEVYRQYNSNQYPFVYLNVIVKSSMVDVNVTPDKRQIFLEKEKLLLATVKTSLIEAFKLFPSTLKVQNLNDSVRSNKRGNEESFLGSFRKKSKGDSEVSPKKNLSILNLKSFKIEKRKNCLEEEKVCAKEEMEEVKTIKLLEPKKFEGKVVIEDENKDVLEKKTDIVEDKLNILEKTDVEDETNISEHKRIEEGLKVEKFSFDNFRSSKSKTNILDETIIEESIACTLTPSKHKFKEPDPRPSTSKSSTNTKQKSVTSESLYKKNQKSIEVNFSLSDIKEALNCSEGEENKEVEVKFRSKIDPSSNEKAERELQLQISKDMFAKMRIIGQFNYAFIIAELDGDLFIVDQHATDEKYNFEELQRTTVVESQGLVNPKDLQLTAAHENVLIENIEVFKKNGFNFQIDENAEATKKVKMTKIPLSKNYIFGKDDIDEMIYMLQEGCDTNCRPTRVRGMFASRACRKSVMVGKALSKTDMRKLIDHMGVIDQPWNCPHGRPTMRHLINLNMLHKFN